MHVPSHRFAMKDLQGFICGFVVILLLQTATGYYRFGRKIPAKWAASIGLLAALAIVCRHIFDLLNLYYSMQRTERLSIPKVKDKEERVWPFSLSVLSSIVELAIIMICYLVVASVSPPLNAAEQQWSAYLSQLTDARITGLFQHLFLLTACAECLWFLWDGVFLLRLRSAKKEDTGTNAWSMDQEDEKETTKFLKFNGVFTLIFSILYFLDRHTNPLPNDEYPYYAYAVVLLVYLVWHAVMFRNYYSTEIPQTRCNFPLNALKPGGPQV